MAQASREAKLRPRPPSQGWLGSKDAVLASGEGPIQVARWSGTLVAWADEAGVKVYDTAVHQHFAFLDRPRHSYAPGAPPSQRERRSSFMQA